MIFVFPKVPTLVVFQIAVHFAELHDTPVRMKEKGGVREIVPWRDARRFFYWRLLRKIRETKLSQQVRKLSQQVRKPSQQVRKLSQEERKLSQPVGKLT